MSSIHPSHAVTLHLERLNAGDRSAVEDLFVLVYGELRALAAACLRHERAGHTLQPTALVHEVYLRLVNQQHANWNDRAHFLAVAAQAIRRILIDHARRRRTQSRQAGANGAACSLDVVLQAEAIGAAGGGVGVTAAPSSPIDDLSLLELHDSLDRLAQLDARQGRVVEMKFFGGMTIEEIAHVLGVSIGTVKNDWRFARAWLQRELERGGVGPVRQGPSGPTASDPSSDADTPRPVDLRARRRSQAAATTFEDADGLHEGANHGGGVR